jgi:DNA polymerase V
MAREDGMGESAQTGRVGRPAGPPTKVVRLPVSIADLARKVAARSIRSAEINAFFDVDPRQAATVPLMTHKAECGFPSPADDYLDRPLDFNELLIKNPAATFAVRIAGDSMTGAGMFPGDIAVVDRSLPVRDRSIVLALLDGEFTIKRYRKKGSRVWLQAENPAYADMTVTEEMTFEVWGVISRAIRMLGGA